MSDVAQHAVIAWDDHKTRYVCDRIAGRDVLDLGCVEHDPENYRSPFWLHKAIAAKAGSVIGLDRDAAGIAYLQGVGFNVQVGDATAFDLASDFDVVVAGDLIEHLGNFDGFLVSVRKHLRPGGALIVSTPNPWYWRNIAKAVAAHEVANNPEHTCWLCPRTLRQLVRRHGMDVSQIRFGSRYPRDRLMPLPRGIKHTSWHAVVS